jgi:hypothetical protein
VHYRRKRRAWRLPRRGRRTKRYVKIVYYIRFSRYEQEVLTALLFFITVPQRRRKQSTLKEQLGKWKASEELNKELMGEASAKLQRPKSVDPGTFPIRLCSGVHDFRTCCGAQGW